MENPKNFFTNTISSGQFAVDENGHAKLFGEYVIFFPSKVILELIEILESKISHEKLKEILLEVSEFQIKQAYKRYISKFGMDKIDKRKIIDFSIDVLNMLGWGKVAIINTSLNDKTFDVFSKSAIMPIRYHEKHGSTSKNPVDTYLLGLLKGIFECVFETDLVAEETKCMAMGHNECRFVGKPVS